MSSRKGPDVEKQQFWRLVFEEHAKSGLSVRAFCRQEDILSRHGVTIRRSALCDWMAAAAELAMLLGGIDRCGS